MPPLLRDQTDQTSQAPPPAAGDRTEPLVVEGRTAEEALEEVHRTVGNDARIIQAEKVRKGGVGGFFTRELVQLTVATGTTEAEEAAPDEDAAQAGPTPGAPTGTGRDEHAGETLAELLDRHEGAPGGLDDVVAELTAATDHRESTFGDALRAALSADAPTDAPGSTPNPAPTDVSTDVPTDVPAGAATGGPAVRAPAEQPRARGGVGVATREAPAWTRVRDPRLTSGATALAQTADRLDTATAPTCAPTRDQRPSPDAPASGDGQPDVGRAEASLDAAVRAVNAGTTAGTVVRAAETGGVTGFAPPELDADRRVGTAGQAEAAPRHTAEPDAATATTRRRVEAVPTERWSADRLLRLGVPEALVRAIVGQRPADDLGWLTAVTRAVTPLVRGLPDGRDVLVGGHAGRFAKASDATRCVLSEGAPRRGSIALTCGPSERALRWLERESRGRWLHLVVGGASWREWLFEQPAAVSWSEPDELPAALTVAALHDLPLGGTVDGDRYLPASPVDVAIALRDLLEPR